MDCHNIKGVGIHNFGDFREISNESTERSHGGHDNMRPSKCTGLDTGKKNIITMVDGDGISLKYTCTTSQRNFKSRLTRYKLVLSKERKKFGINEIVVLILVENK